MIPLFAKRKCLKFFLKFWAFLKIYLKNFLLLVTALKTHPSVRQALISVGLTGAGGNYDRAYNLIHQYNIEHLKK